MFKVKVARVAALVLLATGAAVFMACQRGPSGPTPGELPETDAFYVYGYCYKTLGGTQDGLECKVYCETCDDWVYNPDPNSGPNGYYYCDPAPPDYTTHNGDDVHAVAFDGLTEWGDSETKEMKDGGIQLDIYQHP
jgi:hypothetical protein